MLGSVAELIRILTDENAKRARDWQNGTERAVRARLHRSGYDRSCLYAQDAETSIQQHFPSSNQQIYHFQCKKQVS